MVGVRLDNVFTNPAGDAIVFAANIVGAVVMAYVLVHAVHYAGAHTLGQGAAIGFFGWLGFIGLVTLGQVIYENRPMRYWLINNAYLLISLLIMGAILAVWT